MITRTIKKSFCSVGSLYTWGETTYGWGREVNDKIRVPGQVGTFKNVHKVAAGPYHLLFGTQSKEVYSVGLGSNGRLGHGTSASLDEPQLI
jgi:alpha-tubulin suppressor-like RCC1 family protein